jgi:hypothetical protein
VAAVAVVVIKLASSDLLRVEAEFGIGLAALGVAGEKTQDDHRETETQRRTALDADHKLSALARERSKVG